MSLLEDVFLEDEAGEAHELERVIEGDEFDERPRTPNSNENSEKEDEAEEDKRRVDHTAKAKKVVKNPRFILNPARLTGPRGIQIIPEHFKDFKFKGKGHEREDLDLVLKKLEHWAYRLYPKFKFEDCLKKIETLGKKRPVMVHLHKIRTDQFMSEETVAQKDSSDEETETAPVPEEDEFDRLLQQQIEIARSTPAPGSVRKEMHTPITPVANRSALLAPKVSSSPSISEEQKERMIRNRKLAEERRLAKLNQLNNTSVSNVSNHSTSTEAGIQENDTGNNKGNVSIPVDDNKDDNDVTVVRKHNRCNVIDNSDEEDDIMAVNESITVDIHNTVNHVDPDTNYDTRNAEMNVETISEHIEGNENVDGEIEVDKESSETSVKDTMTKIDCAPVVVEIETDTNSRNIEIETLSEENIDEHDLNSVKSPNFPDDISNGYCVSSNQKETIPSKDDTQKEEIERNDAAVTSVKDTVREIALNENKIIDGTFSDGSGIINNKNIEMATLSEKNVDEDDINCVRTPNVSDDKNNDDDETLHQEIILSKVEATQKEKEEIEKNKTAATEDLMDVDFSDDF